MSYTQYSNVLKTLQCEEQPLKTMLEIMTKERMKKSGDVKRRPVEGDRDQSTEQKPGADAAEDDNDAQRGDVRTDEMRCLTFSMRNMFNS